MCIRDSWNVVDGLLRVAVFVFYLWLIGRMAEIKRMFGYHGAEHKAIHCYCLLYTSPSAAAWRCRAARSCPMPCCGRSRW